jgi:hypothetical protein
VNAMNSRKHIYYITISDIQQMAKEKIGRDLSTSELIRVRDKILDRIQWYDVVEEAITSETTIAIP